MALFVLPLEFHPFCPHGKPVVRLWHKLTDLFLSSGDHGQGRGLDASTGQLGVVLAGQGSGGVDPHHPVCLRPAHGRVI